tara:strand:+ start:233 stop:1144 length:912 start_codon:yes stop_codon:yes gene_type:complete
LNCFPYRDTYLVKDYKKIEVYIYNDYIANADIIIDKHFAVDIIRKFVCHEPTYEFVNEQLIDFFKSNYSTVKILQKIYTIIKKYPINIRKNYIIFSSGILAVYGLRRFNDIDMYIREYNITNKKLLAKMVKELESLKCVRMDITIDGTDKYKKYWDEWKITWCRLAGIKNFDCILDDQNNYIYFFGLRFMSLDIDIVRRRKRNRINGIVDLIMIKKHIRPKLQLWPLPQYFHQFSTEKLKFNDIVYSKKIVDNGDEKYVYYREVDRLKVSRLIKKRLKIRYKEDLSLSNINSILENRIKIKIK